MTTITPETTSAPPQLRRRSAGEWLKKNLFSDWFNGLLTIAVVTVLAYAAYAMLNWAFTVAQWVVIPRNVGLFMTGLYPSEQYWRIWILLGLVCALTGLSWGVLARNLNTLFSRNVLIGFGIVAAGFVVFPPTRPSSPKLLLMVAIVAAAAWGGRTLGRQIPSLGSWVSALWFVSYFVAIWLIGGGPFNQSLLSWLLVLGVSLIAGWVLSTKLGAIVSRQFATAAPIAASILSAIACLALLAVLPNFLFQYLIPPAAWIVAIAIVGILLGLVGFVIPRQYQLGFWLFAAGFGVTLVVTKLILGLLGFSLNSVSTNDWGGMALTLLMAVSGIALCFPLGVTLALGRRSNLPVVRWMSIAYIELIRGVPLIAILFMGQVMIPLFLPEGMRPDRVLRAIIGLTIFSSAYLAENVRAGLQAVPRGQQEAAASLGLNTPLTLSLIVLPQALKIAIPAIVGQFISLFQDTTLLAIVGLAELLGISRSILANPNYLGRYAEVYLFIGIIYWFFCYAMSLGSRKIEEKLNTGH
ncbi:MAG: amino acid ABC transporter permease [Leptolyngbyaceae cyanobacterium]